MGEQIQRELTDLLRREVKDSRIGNVTITAVAVTGDLRTAKVFYLVFGHEGPDIRVQRGLESAAGFLRNALSKALMIRYTPTLSFELDTSIEHGVRLTRLIAAANRSDATASHAAASDGAASGAAASGAAASAAAAPRAAHDGGDDEVAGDV